MRTPVRGEKGFSILEVTIAGALMMGIAFALLQINRIQQRGITANEAQGENVNMLLQIYGYLRDVRSCNSTFGAAIGTVKSETDLEQKGEIPLKAISRRVRNTKQIWETLPAISVGTLLGNNTLRVKDLRIRTRQKWDGFVDLVVKTERVKIEGMMAIEKVIPMPVEMVPVAQTPEQIERKDPPEFLVGCAGTTDLQASGTDLGFGDENANPYGSTGFARDSTVKALETACSNTGGRWIALENRCSAEK